MKRFLCLVLFLSLLLPLPGCQTGGEYAAFYYCRVRFDYGTTEPDGVIASEQRNIEGHSANLSYLLSLYLAGPLDEGLTAVFPKNVQLLNAYLSGSSLFVELSDLEDDFNEAQFTLGCAGLALTFLELTGAEDVTVTSGARHITLSSDSLTLFDSVTENSFTEDISSEVP